MKFPEEKIVAGLDHLREADPVLRQLIEQVGSFRMRLNRDRFGSLVRSIISQQISTGAARSIQAKLETLAGRIAPETLGNLTPAQLKTAGISSQKASYLLDLSAKVLDGQVRLREVSRLTDDQIIEQLIQVKGIGVWTAQMFLMFCLGRLDVFPHADFGIRTALKNLYGLKELPDKTVGTKIAGPWRPYATVACWYCWRSLEKKKSD